MAIHVDPIIVHKLGAFSRRRRALIAWRGACSFVCSLLIALCIVVLLDWAFFLSEAARWSLSLFAYAAAAFVVWLTSLRLMTRVPSASQLARLLESAQPELREDLISAVELGDPTSARLWDSDQFRSVLQHDVAHRLDDLNVRQLLPQRLIKRWVIAATVIITFCGLLLVLPGARFGQRLVRALIPMADIERISQTRINIVAPQPVNLAVPEGETVEIVVELAGPKRDDNVVLETFRGDNKHQQTMMVRARDGERRFTGMLKVGGDQIHYRIRANDARTRKHLIVSRTRPRVVSFHKTYHYPDYTRTAAKTVVEKSGALAAVEGTRVDLVLEADQQLTLAHLTIDAGGDPARVALTPELNPDGTISSRVRGSVLLEKSGRFRVNLVAAETGFTNKFAPDYVLRAEPDNPPRIRVTEPAQYVFVPQDGIISLRGQAEDDWAIQKIEQRLRVNDGEWRTAATVEIQQIVEQQEFQHDWDLYPLKLSAGDVVLTKLVAYDRKGNTGESSVIKMLVSNRGFDPQRLAYLEATRDVHKSLRDLSAAAGQLKAAIAAADSKVGQAGVSPLERQQMLSNAYQAQQHFDESANASLDSLQSATRLAQAGRESRDLVLTGRVVGRALSTGTTSVRHLLGGGVDGIDTQRRALRSAQSISNSIDVQCMTSVDAFESLLLSSHYAVIADNLANMSKRLGQSLAKENMDVANSTSQKRLSRQMIADAGQLQVLEELLANLGQRDDAVDRTKIEQLRQQVVDAKLLASQVGAADRDLNVEAKRLKHILGNIEDRMHALIREKSNATKVSRESLIAQAGSMHELANRVADNAEGYSDVKARISAQAARGALDSLQQDAEEAKKLRHRTTLAYYAATTQFKARAFLEQARSDSAGQFVADVSRAWRAIDAQRRLSEQGGEAEAEAVKNLKQIAAAVHVVSVLHRLDDLVAGVHRLGRHERELSDGQDEKRNHQPLMMLQRSSPGHSFVTPSIDWLWVESQLRTLDEQLGERMINAKAHQLVGAARISGSFQKVQSEMRARAQRTRVVESVVAEMGALSTDLEEIKRLLSSSLYDARALLARLSPRLTDTLADAAEAVRKLEQNTEHLAEDDIPAEAVEGEVRDQLKRMEDLTEEVEQVRSALIEDANEQDVFDEEGRQRMRDIDDALAMLREQPNRAEAALRRAAMSPEEPDRLAAVAEAVGEQRELADRLEQLAQHFDQLDNGEPSPTRQALRNAEEELGIREELEAQHQQLEELARLAQSNPERALAELENQLRESPQMQRALSELNRGTLEDAQNDLNTQAEQQRQVVEQLERLVRERADAPQRVNPEEELAELQRDIDRLANEQVALAAAAADDDRALDDFDRNDRVERAASPPEQVAQQNEVAEALARTQQQLERLADRTRQDGRELSSRQRGQEAAELAESLRESERQLQQASELAAEQGGNQEQPPTPAVSTEQAVLSTQRAAALAEQAAERAEQANQQAQQAARAAQESEDQNEMRSAAQQASRQAARAANRAEQARNAARQAERSAEQASLGDPDAEVAENLERMVREAVQDANSAAEQARLAVQAAGEAIEPLAQANTPEPDTDSPEDEAEQLAQHALRQAVNAAQQGQQAAQAAQRARRAERPGDQDPNVESNSEAPSNEQLAEAQQSAQDLAQRAAAIAAEAAADALEQAEAVAEAVAGAEQANDEPERLRQERQAERAAREAAQAVERAIAANRRTQAAAQLARQPQLIQQQAEQSARLAEELADRAEQLAREFDQQAALEQLASEQPEISEALEQAARDLARADRNQERLGDPQQSEVLGEIASAAESASEAAAAATEQLAANALEQAEQRLAESEQAASELAERLAELLESEANEPAAADGERGGESAGEEAGQPTPGEQGSSGSSPSEAAEQGGSDAAGSEPGGAEPGTSETGASERGTPAETESSPSSQPASIPDQESDRRTPSSRPRIAPQVAAQLARALDQLDQQVFGQDAAAAASGQPEASASGQAPGEPGTRSAAAATGEQSQDVGEQSTGNESGSQASSQSSSSAGNDSQPGTSTGAAGSPSESPFSGARSAQRALAAAARAQSRSMAAARSARSQQSNSPTGGAYASLSNGADVADSTGRRDALPDLKSLEQGNWGDLPPKLARDLLEGSRENVAPEFRKAVESYFRAIAERARARKGNR